MRLLTCHGALEQTVSPAFQLSHALWRFSKSRRATVETERSIALLTRVTTLRGRRQEVTGGAHPGGSGRARRARACEGTVDGSARHGGESPTPKSDYAFTAPLEGPASQLLLPAGPTRWQVISASSDRAAPPEAGVR